MIKRPIFWGANFAVRKENVKESYFSTDLKAYSDLILARKMIQNRKKDEKVIYDKHAIVFSYYSPSSVPKRNIIDHVLAEFGIFRKKIKIQ